MYWKNRKSRTTDSSGSVITHADCGGVPHDMFPRAALVACVRCRLRALSCSHLPTAVSPSDDLLGMMESLSSLSTRHPRDGRKDEPKVELQRDFDLISLLVYQYLQTPLQISNQTNK